MKTKIVEASDNTGYRIECAYGIGTLVSPDGSMLCEFDLEDLKKAYEEMQDVESGHLHKNRP